MVLKAYCLGKCICFLTVNIAFLVLAIYSYIGDIALYG